MRLWNVLTGNWKWRLLIYLPERIWGIRFTESEDGNKPITMKQIPEIWQITPDHHRKYNSSGESWWKKKSSSFSFLNGFRLEESISKLFGNLISISGHSWCNLLKNEFYWIIRQEIKLLLNGQSLVLHLLCCDTGSVHWNLRLHWRVIKKFFLIHYHECMQLLITLWGQPRLIHVYCVSVFGCYDSTVLSKRECVKGKLRLKSQPLQQTETKWLRPTSRAGQQERFPEYSWNVHSLLIFHFLGKPYPVETDTHISTGHTQTLEVTSWKRFLESGLSPWAERSLLTTKSKKVTLDCAHIRRHTKCQTVVSKMLCCSVMDSDSLLYRRFDLRTSSDVLYINIRTFIGRNFSILLGWWPNETNSRPKTSWKAGWDRELSQQTEKI